MVKKYMLIVVCDREFDPPCYFHTYEEAYQAMTKDLASCFDTDAEHLKEHEDYEESFNFNDYSAWASDVGCCDDVDWQIIELPNELFQEV